MLASKSLSWEWLGLSMFMSVVPLRSGSILDNKDPYRPFILDMKLYLDSTQEAYLYNLDAGTGIPCFGIIRSLNFSVIGGMAFLSIFPTDMM